MTNTSRSRKENSSEKPRKKNSRSDTRTEDLGAKLLALTLESGPDMGAVSRRLAALSRHHGPRVYRRFIYLISHLDFSPQKARDHWRAIAKHTAELAKTLGRPIDFRVGLMDYFVNKNHKLKHPKVIDMELFQQTEEGTLRDELTGLYNFRYFKETLPRELGRAQRFGVSLSLIFIDLDSFKAYNDRFGHDAGNEALVRVAEVLLRSVRDIDSAFRYGGEEFAILLPDTQKYGALKLAERIVENVEKMKIDAPSQHGVLTISVGVASFPADAADGDFLLQAADSAMYRAKAAGKNIAIPYSTERRAYPRGACAFEGQCILRSNLQVPIEGRNLSQGGLYFASPRELFPGQLVDLALELPTPSGIHRVSCRTRVAWCETQDDGHYGIGAVILFIPHSDRLRYYQALQALAMGEGFAVGLGTPPTIPPETE